MSKEIIIEQINKVETPHVTKVLFTLLLASWIYWLWTRRKFYIISAKLQGKLSYPLIGNILDVGICTNIIEFLDVLYPMSIKYKSPFTVWGGTEFLIVLSDAEDYEDLFLSKASVNKEGRYKFFNISISDGILIGSGSLWKKHRQIINPSFNLPTIRSFEPIYNKHSKYLVQRLDKFCDMGEINIDKYVEAYVADNITEALFGLPLEFYKGERDGLLDISINNVVLALNRMAKLWLTWDPIYKFTEEWKYCKTSMIEYRNVYHRSLKEKLEEHQKMKNENGYNSNTDYNGMYKKVQTTIEVLAEALIKGEMTEQEVCNEFDNIFNAGFVTTSNNISAFLMMLGMHDEPRRKLTKEIDDFYRDQEYFEVKQSHFRNLPYLDMCFKEISRLFPSAPLVTRNLLEDFRLKNKNLVIPAGTHIMLSMYILNRNPKYWDQPHSFIPERFSKEQSKNRPQFAFTPFLAGPRNCIGQRFAHDMVKTVIINVLRNYDLKSNFKLENLKLSADASLKSATGYKVALIKRIIK